MGKVPLLILLSSLYGRWNLILILYKSHRLTSSIEWHHQMTLLVINKDTIIDFHMICVFLLYTTFFSLLFCYLLKKNIFPSLFLVQKYSKCYYTSNDGFMDVWLYWIFFFEREIRSTNQLNPWKQSIKSVIASHCCSI